MGAKISLNSRNHPLTSAKEQIRQLQEVKHSKRFAIALKESGHLPLKASKIEVLQINLGKLCNMTCAHCHVDAGPDRKEVMNDQILDRVFDIFENSAITTLDVTGGAPEMHPRFREIMQRAGSLPNRRVLHRCNLTAIMTRRFQDIPELLAKHNIEIFASVPCYTEEATDQQRGDGTFTKSIAAIKRLNELGYGVDGTGLILNLVHNPIGAFLPADQHVLESAYKDRLKADYGIVFNQLFAVTNQPISRFLEYLITENRLDQYMDLLVNAFNPKTIDGLMCLNMISIGWKGDIYDCDFNQMLEMKVNSQIPQHILEWDQELLEKRSIIIGEHCYACTAGCGSSCGGQVVE